MKIISVESCEVCPYFFPGKEGEDFCLRYQEKIHDPLDIPSWCPLEDEQAIRQKIVAEIRAMDIASVVIAANKRWKKSDNTLLDCMKEEIADRIKKGG